MVSQRLFLLGCVLVTTLTLGQTPEIEKLERALSTSNGKSARAKAHVDLANSIYDFNLEKGFSNALSGLRFAREARDSMLTSLALTSLGDYYFHKGDNITCETYYRNAIRAASAVNFNQRSFTTYLNLGTLFREQGVYDSASKYFAMADQIPGHAPKAEVLVQQALMENDQSRNENSIALLQRSLTLIPSDDMAQRVKTMVHLSSVYTALAKYDSADLFFRESEQLLSTSPNDYGFIVFHIARGESNFIKGSYSNAIDDYNHALDKLKDNIYRRPYAHLLYLIGELYGNQGVYQTAFEYLFNGLREFESLNARREIARATSQIGWAYNFQQNYSEAFTFGARSLEIAIELNDSASIAQNKNLQGYALLKLGRLDEALTNLESALAIRRRIKNYWGVTYTLYNTSLVYAEMGQRKKAVSLLTESLETDKRIGNKSGYVFTCNELGRLYAVDKQFSTARNFLNEANQLAKQIPLPAQLLTNYKNFILLSELEGDDKKTISYYKRYTALSDSLNHTLNSGRIAKADALFQLQKKTQEIQFINAESALRQERIHAQEAEIEFQRIVIAGSVIGIGLLLMLFFFIYKLLRSNIKAKLALSAQNKSIHEQKEEIQSQAEELTESNMKLLELNTQLEEKNSEIESQSEKIKETNNSLEQRVDERTRQLQHAYQELETFFYRTSHDFRRPLTTYLGLVEIANASIKDEQALYIFNKVKENTLALDGMLNKLQSISNVDYDELNAAIDVSAQIANVLDKFKGRIAEKGIDVRVKTDVKTFYSNAGLVNVILENIIENAVNFNTPLNPKIDVHAFTENKILIVIVNDNGQGIHPEVQGKVFEMYFRGSVTSSGNGLGLYIAKRAVEKLGGSISFTSKYNEGSVFHIKIPSADA